MYNSFQISTRVTMIRQILSLLKQANNLLNKLNTAVTIKRNKKSKNNFKIFQIKMDKQNNRKLMKDQVQPINYFKCSKIDKKETLRKKIALLKINKLRVKRQNQKNYTNKFTKR